MLAVSQRRPRPEPNLIYHVPDKQPSDPPMAALVPVHLPTASNAAGSPAADGAKAGAVARTRPVATAVSWSDPRRPVLPPAAQQVAIADPRVEPGALPAASWHIPGDPVPAAASPSTVPSVDPFTTQVAHPQPLEQTRQTVLR